MKTGGRDSQGSGCVPNLVNPELAGERIVDPVNDADTFCLVVLALNAILEERMRADAEEEPDVRLTFFPLGLHLWVKGELQASHRPVEATDARVGGKLVVR